MSPIVAQPDRNTDIFFDADARRRRRRLFEAPFRAAGQASAPARGASELAAPASRSVGAAATRCGASRSLLPLLLAVMRPCAAHEPHFDALVQRRVPGRGEADFDRRRQAVGALRRARYTATRCSATIVSTRPVLMATGFFALATVRVTILARTPRFLPRYERVAGRTFMAALAPASTVPLPGTSTYSRTLAVRERARRHPQHPAPLGSGLAGAPEMTCGVAIGSNTIRATTNASLPSSRSSPSGGVLPSPKTRLEAVEENASRFPVAREGGRLGAVAWCASTGLLRREVTDLCGCSLGPPS